MKSSPAWRFPLTSAEAAGLVEPILTWYRQHARVLPWRENTDPYRVWISEIMLQQTRVEAVKPYFERFLAALPTVEALAAAPEEQLLKLWEGLGYYNRVRNLQRAAQKIVDEFGGHFPASVESLRALPGIGEYTAGAIASIAFGLPEPAVDGNVLRIFSRVAASRADIAAPATKTALIALLREVFPCGACGDFTQALMELGATVCLPNGAPRCELCPWAEACAARRGGLIAELPVKAKKAARRIEKRTVLLVEHEERIALNRRPETGLLAGLWELPSLSGHLTIAALRAHLTELGCRVVSVEPCGDTVHVFTHLEWRMIGFRVRLAASAGFEHWVSRRELRETLALPSAFRYFYSQL